MLRITGGAWRGRKLRTLGGDATRPSMDQHRQRVMDMLGHDHAGTRVLDLFAGSGAFSFESLSRGAVSAVLVEQAKPALQVIRANATQLQLVAPRCTVIGADCYGLPADPALAGPFDLVFVAPPYPHFRERRADLERLLRSLVPRLAEGSLVVVQADAGDFTPTDEAIEGLRTDDRRKVGRTEFVFLAPR